MNQNNMIYENDEAITNGRLFTDGSEMTQSKRTQLNQWLKWNWNQNPPMTILGLGSLIFLALTLVGLVIDPRTVINEPVWIKPMKFGISIIFYGFTLLWMLTYVKGRKRIVSIVSWATSIGLSMELILIGFQALRGVRSHFNHTTPFDAAIFSAMGDFIVLVWFAGLVTAFLLVRQNFTSRPFGLALTLGMVISMIGAGFAYIMPMPTPSQRAEMEINGGEIEFVGAHSVGVEDGGAGLPFIGWSSDGSDIRVSHFIGLHALQVMPLVGWFIMQLSARRKNGRLRERQQMALIWVAGIGYLSVMFITLWQALRGQPLTSPGGLTLGVFFGIVALLGAVSALILRRHPDAENSSLFSHI